MRHRVLVGLGLLAAATAVPRQEAAADSAFLQNPDNGHFYRLYTTAVSWYTAKSNAEALGGYLVCITSDAENSWVFSNLASGFGTPWIGASDEANENTWTWVSGESWSYTAWGQGEPNNSGNEDQVTFRTDGYWNDLLGTSNQYYIVEWNSDPNGPPEVPTNLSVTSATDARIDLKWTDPSTRETGFEVERATEGGSFSNIGSVAANTVTYADTTVVGETEYSYRVRSVGTGGASNYSNVVTVTTPPVTVADLAATVLSNTRVRLDWTDRSDAETGVEVERGVGSPASGFTPLATLAADTVTYLDTSAQPETTYAYRVRVSGTGGKSSWCQEAYATTPPADPSGISLIAASDTRVVVGWTDASASETGFEVYRADGAPGGDFGVVGTTAADITAWTDDTVQPESTYTYRVRAVNGIGSSEWSLDGSVTTPTFAPTGATAVPLSPTRVRIAWQDNSDAETGYRVVRALAPDGLFRVVAELGPDATEHEDPTASQESRYLYRVAAIDDHGISNWATPGAVDLPANLVVRKATVKRPRGARAATDEAKLTVSGEFDVGEHGPDLSGAATLVVGGDSFAVPGLDAKGKSFRYQADGIRLQLTPAGSQSSRVRFSLQLQDAAVTELAPDDELAITLETDGFRTSGSVRLAGDRFQPPKKGHLVDPSFTLSSVRATLKSNGPDTLTLKGPFHADAVPAAAPDVTIRLRFFEFEAKSAQFQRSGDRWVFQQKDLGGRTVILDYAKGAVSVTLRGVELGLYEKGAQPVRVGVEFGDVFFDDVPLMSSTGKSLKY